MVFFSCFLGAIGRPCHRVQKYWEIIMQINFVRGVTLCRDKGLLCRKALLYNFFRVSLA